MKIINKIKARFDKIIKLEAEIIELNIRLDESEMAKERWFSMYIKSNSDNRDLEHAKDSFEKAIIKQSEDSDVKIKSFQADLTKCQEHNTKLRQELEKAVKDLEISRASEKETKQLLLETMKLNNALNTRVTRSEVSEPVGDKVNMEEIINLNKE